MDTSFTVQIQVTVTGEQTGKVWDRTTNESMQLDGNEVGQHLQAVMPAISSSLMSFNAKVMPASTPA